MDIEQEKASIEQATAISRLMADVLQRHDSENKRLWIAVIVSICVNVIMAFCMVFYATNMQKSMNDAVYQALSSVGEVTTTTTMSADGENATINNVDGEQTNNYESSGK